MKIYAVITTYNRLDLLKKCLDGLRMQTHSLDKIVVVNNGSTDGTTEFLELESGLFVIHQRNLGGAGGFYTGMKYASENGAEWVWMMDDDVVPADDCLENLLKYTFISECIHPTRFFLDGKRFNWEHCFSLMDWKIIDFPLSYFINHENNASFVNVGCFEGMLISQKIIAKIGFPDSRFFIAGDDTVYGFMASLYTNVSVVKNAHMYRAKKSTDLPYSPLFLYYNYRNFHLFNEYCKNIYNKNLSFKTHINYWISALKYMGGIIKEKRVPSKHKFKYLKSVLRGVMHSYMKI